MRSPLTLLIALLALCALGVLLAEVFRRRRSAVIAQLARQWQMRFLPDDRFNLAPCVAQRLSAPGAADVVVKDLIYGHEATSDSMAGQTPPYRYFFTVEYTIGIVRAKHRRMAFATLSESRCDGGGAGYSPITLAPPDLRPVQAYQYLHHCARTGAEPQAEDPG